MVGRRVFIHPFGVRAATHHCRGCIWPVIQGGRAPTTVGSAVFSPRSACDPQASPSTFRSICVCASSPYPIYQPVSPSAVTVSPAHTERCQRDAAATAARDLRRPQRIGNAARRGATAATPFSYAIACIYPLLLADRVRGAAHRVHSLWAAVTLGSLDDRGAARGNVLVCSWRMPGHHRHHPPPPPPSNPRGRHGVYGCVVVVVKAIPPTKPLDFYAVVHGRADTKPNVSRGRGGHLTPNA